MLSYDATLALLTASSSALSIGGGKKNITPGDVRQALGQVKLQGVSGPIQFGSDGNAINKPFVILSVNSNNDIQEKSLQGCLLPSPCS